MPRVRLALSALVAAALLAGAAVPVQPRWMQVLVLAALLGALGAIGWRAAEWLVPSASLPSRVTAAFTVAVALTSMVATALGHVGAMRPPAYLMAAAGLFLVSRAIPGLPELNGENPARKTELMSAALRPRRPLPERVRGLVVHAPLPGLGRAPRAGGVAGGVGGLEAVERALAFAAALSLAASAVVAAWALHGAPAGHFGRDDVSYHLAAMATWHQHGDLRMMKFSFGDPSTPFYPILGEICSWVLLAPLRDSDFAARWSALPFYLASLAAIAAVARRLGLSTRSALLAVLLFGSIHHVYPVLALAAGNDHVASFFTLAAVDAALALARRPRPGEATYAGLALGLLAGTKYLGLLFAAPLLVLVAAGLLAGRPDGALLPFPEDCSRPWPAPDIPPRMSSRAQRGIWAGARTPGLRKVLVLAAILAGTAAVSGGYVYLRNAVSAGNPVFPSPVRLPGLELPGWDHVSLSYRRQLPEAAIDVPRFLTRRPDLFGPLFAFTMLPAAGLAPVLVLGIALARRARAGVRTEREDEMDEGEPLAPEPAHEASRLATENPRAALKASGPPSEAFGPVPAPLPSLLAVLVFALPAAFFLIFLFLVGDHRESRYLLPGIALAAVAFVWLLERAGPRVGSWLRSALFLFLTFDLTRRLGFGPWKEVLAAMALLAAGGFLLAAGPRLAAWLGRLLSGPGAVALTTLGLVALALASPVAGRRIDRYQEQKLADRPAARALDLATLPAVAAVAYVGFNQPYHFFGSRLQNDVQIVPNTWDLDAQYYEWGGSTAMPYGGTRFARWWKNLVARRVGFVVIQRSHRADPERAWVLGHPHRFRPLYRDPEVEIYEVTRGQPAGRAYGPPPVKSRKTPR